MIDNNNVKPFMKWVGGKTQLLPQISKRLPTNIDKHNITYVEPFVGGGAMLFYMLRNYKNINRVIINDINPHLIKAYKQIKEDPELLIQSLMEIEKKFLSLNNEELRKDFFLARRDDFNSEHTDRVKTVTLLLFLNKTCFNGMYRENSKGHFNVPFGRYKNPTICNEDVIRADSAILNRVDIEILNGNYSDWTDLINDREHCFIYFDPPYRPLSNTSSFTTYSKSGFNDENQKELAKLCRKIDNLEQKWMLSNSDCSDKNPDDLFFENLYEDFNINRVSAKRYINSKGSGRGNISELLITNYDNYIIKSEI